MDEVFPIEDKNALFNKAKTMHDRKMLYIDYADGCIIIQYQLEDHEYYNHFKKATVTYRLSDAEDFSLNIFCITRKGRIENYSTGDQIVLKSLNGCNMLMYSFSIDEFDEMTLHFNIVNAKKYGNAELTFTPTEMIYHWE